MRIALAQMEMSENEQDNLVHSLTLLEEAAAGGADLVLYPEVQLSPFFAQFPGNTGGCCGGAQGPRALKADDPALSSVKELCHSHRIMASPNFYYEENGKKYDASFLIDKDGRQLGIQKMVHIAQVPKFYEQDYYTPSDDGFHVFDTEFGPMGVVVCFDRHYPESIRSEAVMGAQLVLIPTANIKSEPNELFEQEIRVQAYQSECFIAMCNRVGKEAGVHFSGFSIVAGPDGEIIAKAGPEEELLFADIDLSEAKKAREERPYLSLRRTEFYK